MPDDDSILQMPLFQAPAAAVLPAPPPPAVPQPPPPEPPPQPAPPETPVVPPQKAARTRPRKQLPPKRTPQAAKYQSGQVPEGDVRLTANIRQDLHLKLKIAAAHRRTTIGELIEELVEKHLRP